MSASPNQLDEIYSQIKKDFVSHPIISVIPIKGDPPDQYEITYTITGMRKSANGKIIEAIDHKVELAIPFGFPHFPPSCKPKSDVFHPDFDPAAICLGDFWEQDRTLSDVIIHIGQMINGEIYSTTNAFNEDAADWYLKNTGKFPFMHVNWGLDGDSTASSHNRTHEIDTLDDADLASEFDFLALEKGRNHEDFVLNTSFPEVDSSEQGGLELFSQLKNQKKYYALLRTGESADHSSAELNTLCLQAREEIDKAERLHSDGKKFENKGDAKIALEKYQQIATIVTDFPNLGSDIHRIKQTLALIADISPNTTPEYFDSKTPAKDVLPPAEKLTKSATNGSLKPAKKIKIAQPQMANDLFAPEDRRKSKLPLFLALGLTAVVLGYCGYLWYSFTDKLGNAETAYAQCSTAHANNQFDVAKRSCDEALQLVKGVKFIHQDFAHQLEKFILEILQSEKLTQGLAGNILLDGKYIPIKDSKTLLLTKQQLSEADAFFEAKKWQSALELYDVLLTQPEKTAYLDSQLTEDIKRKRLLCEFRISYDPAAVFIQKKQWEEAIDKLLQAQKILVSLPETDREKYSKRLQLDLQKSQFENLKEQGDLSFTGTDWLSAIASYNLALASGQKTTLPPESIDAIRNNIKRAELYNTINTGNKAFAAGSWDDAIKAYSQASGLLSGSKVIPGEIDSDLNIQKLTRIILQATIIRDRELIQTLLKNDDVVKARRTYQQIVNAITHSSFGAEEEFVKTSAEINTAIQQLDKKIFLDKKTEYLKNNYQQLFIANYPTAIPENLTNPVISNTKETESKLVFRMQCTENGGGRPLNLVMFYAYDKKSGKWSFYSEN